MNKGAFIWNLAANKYSKQPIANIESYEKKLAITRKYLTPDSQILEFGCGTGGTALIHAPRVKSIDAIDYSKNMIEIANAKKLQEGINNVNFSVADITELQTSDKKYDVILGLNIVHLLEDKAAVFAKVHEMLNPGGYFISSTPCLDKIPLIFKLLISTLSVLQLVPNIKRLSEAELLDGVRAAGFSIEEQWNPNLKIVSIFLVAKKVD